MEKVMTQEHLIKITKVLAEPTRFRMLQAMAAVESSMARPRRASGLPRPLAPGT
jgi:hypothetical protein